MSSDGGMNEDTMTNASLSVPSVDLYWCNKLFYFFIFFPLLNSFTGVVAAKSYWKRFLVQTLNMIQTTIKISFNEENNTTNKSPKTRMKGFTWILALLLLSGIAITIITSLFVINDINKLQTKWIHKTNIVACDASALQ